MSKNKYTVVSYNNYEIKVLVFLLNDKKPFLIFEELIEKVNINEFTSDFDRDKISAKIAAAIKGSMKISKNKSKQVIMVFDSNKFFHDSKSLTFEYTESHVIDNSDMRNIYLNAIKSATIREGFTPVNFQLQSFLINNNHVVQNPLGSTANQIVALGDLVYADYDSVHNMKLMLNVYDVEIVEEMVGGYLLANAMNLIEKEGIVEIGTNRINFAVNINEEIKQFSIEFGFKKILDTVYDNLIKEFKSEDSELAVRFLMEYFPLKIYPTDQKLFGDITINYLIELFNRVICDYFRFIFKELENKKVDCNRYYVLIHEYEQNDFIEFLNENLDVELSAFEIPGFRNITSANLKPALAVVRFQEKMDRLDDRGNNG